MNNILFNFFFSFSIYPFISWFFLIISNIFIYVFIIVAILYPLYKDRDYIYSLLVGETGLFAYILSYIVKHIFMIPRPFITNHITPLVFESSYSFPSSHVTVMTALSIVIWKINHKLGYAFFIFTILTVLSRMILGVHYPADVLGGMVFGTFTALIILWLYKATNQFAFLRKKL